MESSRLGQRAIVVGGSIAGMVTARVLADFFDRVILLDRDEIEARPALHRSIPHGNHYHALLAGGYRVIEELYPDFPETAKANGSVEVPGGVGIRYYLAHGAFYNPSGTVSDPRSTGLDAVSQTRGCLEHSIRTCTLRIDNIDFRSPRTVTGLLFESGRVLGVETPEEELEADLVVDAGGRGSRARRWLGELGYETPAETSIGVDLAYSSAKFRVPDGHDEPDVIKIGFDLPPRYPNGAILGEVEGGQWHVTAAGRFGEYPPKDPDGFMHFLKHIHTDKIYTLVKDTERVSDVRSYRFPASLRRHYESLREFPLGFVVIGDAISSFNPVYGQGMTSAALQAEALRSLLQERVRTGRGADDVAMEFFPKAAAVVDTAWTLAANQDLAFPKTAGERPPNLEQDAAYIQSLSELAVEDNDVFELMAEVLALAKPFTALLADDLQAKVAAYRRG
jgi:2-polyprenyl-6-methoxyphenol hydroxylase-like FAD-dependent oxidoreductase